MDAVSAAVIVVGLLVIVALLNFLGKNALNSPVRTWSDRQLSSRSRAYGRLIQACMDANEPQRAEEYKARLDAIRDEIARRRKRRDPN